MCIDGEICAYVRGLKDKNSAIDMAAAIFKRSKGHIISALQSYGLMDNNGKYIEPVRLTGKEYLMENGKEKRKINYPSFQWSPKRQEILKNLYQEGKSVPEIAAHFETDEGTIYKAVAKYNLVRVTNKPSQEDAAPVVLNYDGTVEGIKAALAQMPRSLRVTADQGDSFTSSLLAKDDLTRIKEFINAAFIITGRMVDSIKNDKDCDLPFGFIFELGKQYMTLYEADKSITSIVTRTFPEP